MSNFAMILEGYGNDILVQQISIPIIRKYIWKIGRFDYYNQQIIKREIQYYIDVESKKEQTIYQFGDQMIVYLTHIDNWEYMGNQCRLSRVIIQLSFPINLYNDDHYDELLQTISKTLRDSKYTETSIVLRTERLNPDILNQIHRNHNDNDLKNWDKIPSVPTKESVIYL
jgi:hypothetical protein